MQLPRIIQGGMGAAVSGWRLAQAVSRLGQLGVVSGTGLDVVMCRRLQDGDEGGHVRRALEHFPFPDVARRVLDSFFVPDGKPPRAPYKHIGMHTVDGARWPQEVSIVGNFVEVFLAREGHANPVGINYLEKIQLPHLPAIYGAMLAGVAVVIMGAGIPVDIPAVLDAYTNHEPAEYPIRLANAAASDTCRMRFEPRAFWPDGLTLPALSRPVFLPIVASEVLAMRLVRKTAGVDGLIIEGPTAGGHNAPPRGKMVLSESGEPTYGARDEVDVEAIRKLGVPFWLAGGYASPEKLQAALAAGAHGVQVGTAFALCAESDMVAAIRHEIIGRTFAGTMKVFTDPMASPTGFPFKVAQLPGTLSDPAVYAARRRICDLGFLRDPYRRDDGRIGYRCPAEPEDAFVAKGGTREEAAGRKCLCNALIANVGMPQWLPDGTSDKPMITLGDDVDVVRRFCTPAQPEYTAADVIRVLLG